MATKSQIKKERDPQKIKRVLIQKGYPNGKLPKGKELHHIIPVAEGGKTTRKNTRVISASKHKKIHSDRKARGEI